LFSRYYLVFVINGDNRNPCPELQTFNNFSSFFLRIIIAKSFYIVILRYTNNTMGTSKTNLFSEQQNQLAVIAKVLGHPARIAILQYILKSPKCINSSLVNELGLAQATISQHLKELKQAEIIKGSIEGNSMCYCINDVRWEEIKNNINQFFNQHTATCEPGCC